MSQPGGPTAVAARWHLQRRPLPAGLDPLSLLDLPAPPGRGPRCAWLAPDGSGLVGLGAALDRRGAGASLHELRGWLDEAAAMLETDPADQVLGRLRFFVGCAFDAGRPEAPGGRWQAFGAARAVLPSILATFGQDGDWLTLVGPDHEATLAARADALMAALPARGDPPPPSPPARPDGAPLSPAAAAALRRRVLAALAAIRSGSVEKVVLATAHRVPLAVPPDPVQVLRRLHAAEPDCFAFLFEPEPGRAFLGASPERLLAVDGRSLRTMALAGSAPRGADEAADEQAGVALLASQKDRLEHQLVIDALRDVLAPLARSLDLPDQPRLRRLSTLQHLETPVTATLAAPADILQLAERLHPTPALAGSPRAAALDLIRRVEDEPRGWYGGLVGWADATGGDGDLTVAIRCLLLDGSSATAFAGAGIVAGSDPDREVAEIQLKLAVALRALGPPA